jgi:Dna[CI] antecedent, DciA
MAQKRPSLKPILSYPNRTIAQLSLQINQQLAILAQIKAVLPKELATHVLHCVTNNNKLIVYTDSANWASQLRFYGKSVIDALEPYASIPATNLQFKIIAVPTPPSIRPKHRTLIPSQAVALEIHNQSLSTTDPQLKAALKNLSSTLEKLRSPVKKP